MHAVTSLTIVYDASCRLCTRLKVRIGRQPSVIRLRFAASGSVEARPNCPSLPFGELAEVDETGEVWLGNHAGIVCLWALRDHRDLGDRLTSPLSRWSPERHSGCIQESFRIFKYAQAADRAIEQHLRQGRRSEMPNRGEVRPA